MHLSPVLVQQTQGEVVSDRGTMRQLQWRRPVQRCPVDGASAGGHDGHCDHRVQVQQRRVRHVPQHKGDRSCGVVAEEQLQRIIACLQGQELAGRVQIGGLFHQNIALIVQQAEPSGAGAVELAVHHQLRRAVQREGVAAQVAVMVDHRLDQRAQGQGGFGDSAQRWRRGEFGDAAICVQVEHDVDIAASRASYRSQGPVISRGMKLFAGLRIDRDAARVGGHIQQEIRALRHRHAANGGAAIRVRGDADRRVGGEGRGIGEIQQAETVIALQSPLGLDDQPVGARPQRHRFRLGIGRVEVGGR